MKAPPPPHGKAGALEQHPKRTTTTEVAAPLRFIKASHVALVVCVSLTVALIVEVL